MRTDPTLQFFSGGDLLIDLGCGDGAWLDGAHHRYRRAIGFDSGALPQHRRQKAVEGWEFVASDLNSGVPLPDASVDGARANHVIEHVENPITFASEVWRVLKPGGVFVVTTPNIRYVKHLASLGIRGRGPLTSSSGTRTAECWDGGHIHFFTPTDLRWLAREVGFRRAETQAVVDTEGRLRLVRSVLAARPTNRLIQNFFSGVTLLAAWK